MISVQGKTVREIALESPLSTRVFEELKIDYCCHGDTPFDEACQRAGANPDSVLELIDGVLDASTGNDEESFSAMPVTELVDHILKKHHIYARDEMENLTPLMAKVASRHGEHYQYLLELKDLFQEVCDDLEPHMRKEEMVLFPYIQKLDHCHSHKLSLAYPPFGTVQHPIDMMTIEHEEVGELLSKMRAVTNDYSLPDGACPSFTGLYHRLVEFERDLHQHIHLENNLLFPRAAELERQAFGTTAAA